MTLPAGSYGVPVDLRFSSTYAFLLENGWILAFPHVRYVIIPYYSILNLLVSLPSPKKLITKISSD